MSGAVLDELFGAFVVRVSTRVKAPASAVWGLITDVARMSAFSPELVEAHWVDRDKSGPIVGARFMGTNNLGGFEWARVCTVVAAEEPSVFAYVVGDRFDGAPTGEWRFELEVDGDETVLHQRFSHAPEGRSGTRLLADQDPAHAQDIIDVRRDVLERGMASTLEAIKETIEKG
jgi:uncharacterized protein YndB with AHSA1/START domain